MVQSRGVLVEHGREKKRWQPAPLFHYFSKAGKSEIYVPQVVQWSSKSWWIKSSPSSFSMIALLDISPSGAPLSGVKWSNDCIYGRGVQSGKNPRGHRLEVRKSRIWAESVEFSMDGEHLPTHCPFIMVNPSCLARIVNMDPGLRILGVMNLFAHRSWTRDKPTWDSVICGRVWKSSL